jgi:hypothetical protein
MQPGLQGLARRKSPSAVTLPQLCGGFAVTPRRMSGSSMMITAFPNRRKLEARADSGKPPGEPDEGGGS